jgi:hypothetical protein
VTGAESSEWQRAVRALAASEAIGDDCERVQLNVAEPGAHLTFTTLDGRRAERTLARPEELQPTVAALGVTIGLDDPAPPERTPVRPASVPELAADAPIEQQPESVSGSQGSGVVFALCGGTRGGAEALFSPVLGGSVSLVLGRWEVGVLTAYEFQYFDLDEPNTPSNREATAIVVGAVVGHREPLGSITVLAGGRASIAALFHETRSESLAEARLGTYLGASFPRRAGTRFRAEIGADIVASGSSSDQAVSGPAQTLPGAEPPDDGSVAPWWAVSLLLGVEMGGP